MISGSRAKDSETAWRGATMCMTCGVVFDEKIDVSRCPECETILTFIDVNPFGDTEIARQYEIVSLLGRGGNGLVFKARQISLDRYVAIKMLHTHLLSDPATADRFRREAALVSKLMHPNITTVFDFGILPNQQQPYLIMEYLPGTNLEEVLKDVRRLPFDEALPIIRQACDGLQAAHEKNIVHRDLKPSNIRLISTGGQTVVKIMDFGLARLVNNLEVTPERLTRTGQTVGTPSFMSPEQCRGDTIDQRSDLYSLGCVIYETLTGAPVIREGSVYEMMHQHVHEQAPPLSSHGISVPKGMQSIVDKLLAKQPSERYQTALELKKAIDAVVGTSAPAPAPAGQRQTQAQAPLKSSLTRPTAAMPTAPREEAPPPIQIEPERSFFGKIIDGITGFFTSLNVRLVLLFLIGAAVCLAAADYLYPMVTKEVDNQITINLAEQAKKQLPTSEQILQEFHKYNLAWYYVASPDGAINPKTAAFAPKLGSDPQLTPRSVEWKGRHYWEAVSPINKNQLLHVGFDASPIFAPSVSDKELALANSCPLGAVLLAFGGLLLFIMVSLENCISKHLRQLTRACQTLLLSRDAYSGVTGGSLNVGGAISEVKRMSWGLKQIRMQYDESVAARVSREDELRRQKVTHDTEKQLLTKEYSDQLTQTQAKISELNTKDVEEEFINHLAKEIDMLKSSGQVCQRVLDKLNDKFPTSIVFGAFFRVDRSKRLALVASLGFNERSLTQLKRHDHTTLAENLFSTGTYSTFEANRLKEQQMGWLSEEHGIKVAIMMPVTFQGRDLGMLAIYLRNERDVPDRLRVLRNVVDLASRQLYQTTLYEEEVEAARTDPMTGLRNKKYFYEITPTMFERAANNPAGNPISFAIIDGDKFKSINDTYGHQVGDQMLQELANTLRRCVRSNQGDTSTSGRGDHLIRFGGEEFLVVMERTPAEQAYEVAERIRQAVEQKTNWPGGISNWTVSIGVATYPSNAKNAEDLMHKADTALYYVKEELGRNRVCAIENVPRTYKGAKKAAMVSGELGVFEPAALLQSMATAQKSGILTVKGHHDKHFWMLLEAGKPVQAKLGKFGGAPAIVEFITTFDDGNFNFQEKPSRSSTSLPKLAEEFTVTKGLERCLMDAALAQDNYNAAKTIIPSENVWFRPAAGPEFEGRWKAVMMLPEPPTKEETEVMADILRRAGSGKRLNEIFTAMDSKLSSVTWRCAALLVQHGLASVRPE